MIWKGVAGCLFFPDWKFAWARPLQTWDSTLVSGIRWVHFDAELTYWIAQNQTNYSWIMGLPFLMNVSLSAEYILICVCYNNTCINPCAHCQITGMKSLLITVLISCSCHFNCHYYWTSKRRFDGWKGYVFVYVCL